MVQKGIVCIRAHLYYHETALHIWVVRFENNCRCARASTPCTKSILLMIINISFENADFELFHIMWHQNGFQNGLFGVRAHLYDHEKDFKVWRVSFENNCRCARAAKPRTKSIFLVIMEISHENVDFLLFHSPCDQNRLQNDIVFIRADLYDYKTAL